MSLLKLFAMDEADLSILSAHLQDAVLRAGDMFFLPEERRFAAMLNRFDWAGAARAPAERAGAYQRRLSSLRFEHVLGAQFQQLPLDDRSFPVELLAVNFEMEEAPGGYIVLFFAGGGTIRLRVECIEAELCDLGPVWNAKQKPEHSGDTTP